LVRGLPLAGRQGPRGLMAGAELTLHSAQKQCTSTQNHTASTFPSLAPGLVGGRGAAGLLQVGRQLWRCSGHPDPEPPCPVPPTIIARGAARGAAAQAAARASGSCGAAERAANPGDWGRRAGHWCCNHRPIHPLCLTMQAVWWGPRSAAGDEERACRVHAHSPGTCPHWRSGVASRAAAQGDRVRVEWPAWRGLESPSPPPSTADIRCNCGWRQPVPSSGQCIRWPSVG
jgi:hypothetical protein